MLHGTSSVFLDSILEHGLIPNPTKKYWDNYERASEDDPSCKSLTGIYLTSYFDTAYDASTNATVKFGGDRLFIECQVDITTAIPDEDHIWPWIEDNLLYILKRFNYTNDTIMKFKGFYDSASTYDLNTIHKIYTGRLNNDLGGIDSDIKNNYEILSESFEIALERRSSHIFKTNPRKYYVDYQSEHKLFRVPSTPKDIATAECNYLNVVDKLCYLYKKSCTQTDRKGHSLRILKPIKFETDNHIKSINIVKDKDIKTIFGLGLSSKFKDKLLNL